MESTEDLDYKINELLFEVWINNKDREEREIRERGNEAFQRRPTYEGRNFFDDCKTALGLIGTLATIAGLAYLVTAQPQKQYKQDTSSENYAIIRESESAIKGIYIR